MRSSSFALFVLAALLWLAPAAKADSVITSGSFSEGFNALSAFDPSLGTLTSVEITINGSVTVQVASTPNLIDCGGGVACPLPFTAQVGVDQSFSGLSPQYFNGTSLPGFLTGTVVFTGTGDAESVSIPFFYAFQFNATTDLVGFTIASGTSPINGTLSDFVQTLGAIDLENVVTTPDPAFTVPLSGVTTGTIIPITQSASGGILVEYDYTPASTPPTVPEPASLFLLGTGLLGVLGATRGRNLSQRS